MPGLDFERYLQPSQRCSLSPRETVAVETLSPMAVDIELESPQVPSENLLSQQKAGMTNCLLTPLSPSSPEFLNIIWDLMAFFF